MAPPTEVIRIGEARENTVERLERQALAALGETHPYLGADLRPYQAALTEVAPTLLVSQQAAVATSEPFLDGVLAKQGVKNASEIRLRPEGWLDLTDGGGSWVRNLLYAPPSAYKRAVADGLGTAVAEARARYVSQVITLDGIRDAKRAADSMGMFGRRVTRYVRMLRGQTCSRCAILAGRIYKVEGFRRHPNCDCYHVPLAETNGRAGKWATDPAAYFDSLSVEEQNRIFGEGAALAIRSSTSKELAMSQVVNADKGVYTVTAFGRELQATREGITKRGVYGGYEVLPDGSFRKRTNAELLRDRSISPYRLARQPRLMPDQILALSEEFGWSREMTIEQFRRFGYIF